MNYIKHIVAIFVGLISTTIIGALTTHLVMSDMPIQNMLAATVILSAIGGFIALGVRLAYELGRYICTEVLGWFF